jgi:hypothetical protein
MSGCTKWYHVWRGNRIDEVFETLIRAKKHAAWLQFTCGGEKWFNRVSITLEGEVVSFDDYEFKNGDSRKVSTANTRAQEGDSLS